MGANYRAWRRHHFHFGFYDLSRDAIKTLTAEIPGQDPPVLAGAQADSGLHLKLFKVGYTFSFWNDDRVDLGAGLGFHIADIKTWVDVLAGAEGEGVIVRQVLLSRRTPPCPFP